MKAVTVVPRSFIPAGRLHVMANIDHPDINPWTTIDEAEHVVVGCHPGDEERVRAIMAVERARPLWWRDLDRIEAALRSSSG